MRISDWSSDVCSSDLTHRVAKKDDGAARRRRAGPVDEREKVGLDTREPAFAIVAERGCRERILAMPAMVDRRDVHPAADDRGRSAARRVGKEWVSPCSSRWDACH